MGRPSSSAREKARILASRYEAEARARAGLEQNARKAGLKSTTENLTALREQSETYAKRARKRAES